MIIAGKVGMSARAALFGFATLGLALGASPRAVARMVVREGLVVTLAGAIAGLVLALILGRLSSSVLFGIGASDPPTYAAVVMIIFAVALLASWAPAVRAMRVDPVRTLRAE